MILQERGWEAIRRTSGNPQTAAYLPGPVLTETISVARRKGNQSSPHQLHQVLLALGLSVLHPTDAELIRAAVLIEISESNPGPPPSHSDRQTMLSLGDSMILAITELRGYKVLTRDAYWRLMIDQDLISIEVIVP